MELQNSCQLSFGPHPSQNKKRNFDVDFMHGIIHTEPCSVFMTATINSNHDLKLRKWKKNGVNQGKIEEKLGEIKKSWERKNTDNQLSVYTQLSDLYLLEIYISAS